MSLVAIAALLQSTIGVQEWSPGRNSGEGVPRWHSLCSGGPGATGGKQVFKVHFLSLENVSSDHEQLFLHIHFIVNIHTQVNSLPISLART